MSAQLLVAIGSWMVLALGVGHLVLTYCSRAFSPRDAALEAQLRRVSPFITGRTSMWRGQRGFHASHSLGMIAFSAVYGDLAWHHDELFFQSHFLMGFGAAVLITYIVLAGLYWFFLPLVGFVLALGCYVAGLLLAQA